MKVKSILVIIVEYATALAQFQLARVKYIVVVKYVQQIVSEMNANDELTSETHIGTAWLRPYSVAHSARLWILNLYWVKLTAGPDVGYPSKTLNQCCFNGSPAT